MLSPSSCQEAIYLCRDKVLALGRTAHMSHTQEGDGTPRGNSTWMRDPQPAPLQKGGVPKSSSSSADLQPPLSAPQPPLPRAPPSTAATPLSSRLCPTLSLKGAPRGDDQSLLPLPDMPGLPRPTTCSTGFSLAPLSLGQDIVF